VAVQRVERLRTDYAHRATNIAVEQSFAQRLPLLWSRAQG